MGALSSLAREDGQAKIQDLSPRRQVAKKIFLDLGKDHLTRATFRNITIQEAARALQFDLGIETAGRLDPMRIVDKTGLTGNYTFRLYYQLSLPNSTEPTGNVPDLLTAIQKQLGLRLEKGEGVMLDVYIIDQAQKIPIEN